MENSSSCCSTKSGCCCVEMSKCVWKNPVKGIIVTLVANIIFFTMIKEANFLSLLANLFLYFIIFRTGKRFIFGGNEECQKKDEIDAKREEKQMKMKQFFEGVSKVIEEITSLQDPFKTIRFTLSIYFLLKFLSLLPMWFLYWIIMNISILYAPINKICPNFLFNGFIAVKQVLEGIFGIIECFIPRYVEEAKKEKKE